MINTEDDSLLYRSGQSRGRLLWFIGIGVFIAWNLLLFILAVVAIAKVVRSCLLCHLLLLFLLPKPKKIEV